VHRAELEEAHRMAERELHPLRQRQEQIRQLERDKEAMPRDYASLVPNDRGDFDAAGRHHAYRRHKTEVTIARDGDSVVSEDVLTLCEMETLPT
jgi:hypothetical protein